ncbi:protein S-acyltransferase [Malassezia sp. CBS 17886]|nr:protein S-acyltransferase [Malassezia sp. CBS 17886]
MQRAADDARSAAHLASCREQWEAVGSYLRAPDWRGREHGVDETGIPSRLEQLCLLLLYEDAHMPASSLGACMEYVVEHDVLGAMRELSADDEPRGIRRATVDLYSRLVAGLGVHFLAHQSVARALARLLQETGAACGDTQVSDAVVDLLCHVSDKMERDPTVLVLLLRNARGDGAGAEPLPLLRPLLQHMGRLDERGGRVRAALPKMVRAFLDVDGSLAVQGLSHAALPEALAAAVASAYEAMPRRVRVGLREEAGGEACIWAPALDTRGGCSEQAAGEASAWVAAGEGGAATDTRVASSAASSARFAPSCSPSFLQSHYVALLHFTKEVVAVASSVASELASQLEVDVIAQLRAALLEGAIQTAVNAARMDDGSAAAVLLYHSALLNSLSPSGPLAHAVLAPVAAERTIAAVTSEAIDLGKSDGAPARGQPVRDGVHVGTWDAIYARGNTQKEDRRRGADDAVAGSSGGREEAFVEADSGGAGGDGIMASVDGNARDTATATEEVNRNGQASQECTSLSEPSRTPPTPLALTVLALQTATRHNQWVALQMALMATPPPLPPCAPTTVGAIHTLAVLAQSLQTPRHRDFLPHRFLMHLTAVESTMMADPDYGHAEARMSFGGEQGVYGARPLRPPRLVRECVAPDEYFLAPLIARLCHFFCAPPAVNVAVVDALSTLCRSPFVRTEGLLTCGVHGDQSPLIAQTLYRLRQQVRSFADHVADFSFYVGRWKNELLDGLHLGTGRERSERVHYGGARAHTSHAPRASDPLLCPYAPHPSASDLLADADAMFAGDASPKRPTAATVQAATPASGDALDVIDRIRLHIYPYTYYVIVYSADGATPVRIAYRWALTEAAHLVAGHVLFVPTAIIYLRLYLARPRRVDPVRFALAQNERLRGDHAESHTHPLHYTALSTPLLSLRPATLLTAAPVAPEMPLLRRLPHFCNADGTPERCWRDACGGHWKAPGMRHCGFDSDIVAPDTLRLYLVFLALVPVLTLAAFAPIAHAAARHILVLWRFPSPALHARFWGRWWSWALGPVVRAVVGVCLASRHRLTWRL